MFIISTVHYTSSFSVVYLNLLFLNSSLAIVSILEMKCTWQPPTLVQFSQHWCMSVYVCMYPNALALCTFCCWSALLYIGVTACWRLCQLGGHMEVLATGASRLWATLGPNLGICSIGRRQGQPLYRPHSEDPGQRPPPDASFCSHSALRHFEINLAVIWFQMVHFTKRPCCSEVVLKAF